MSALTFREGDVFSSAPILGNPVAVVHDADELTDTQMADFAVSCHLPVTPRWAAPMLGSKLADNRTVPTNSSKNARLG